MKEVQESSIPTRRQLVQFLALFVVCVLIVLSLILAGLSTYGERVGFRAAIIDESGAMTDEYAAISAGSPRPLATATFAYPRVDSGFPFRYKIGRYYALRIDHGGRELTPAEVDVWRPRLAAHVDQLDQRYRERAVKVLMGNHEESRIVWWAIVADFAFLGLLGFTLLTGAKLARVFRCRRKAMRRIGLVTAGMCPHCRYDIRHSAHTCPECGTPLERPSRP